MIVPSAPGAQSQNSGSHEEPPASHVGRPHPYHPSLAASLRLTVTERSADGFPSGSGRRASLRRSPTASLRRRTAEKDRDVAAADGFRRTVRSRGQLHTLASPTIEDQQPAEVAASRKTAPVARDLDRR
jgi:hypothetical protein